MPGRRTRELQRFLDLTEATIARRIKPVEATATAMGAVHVRLADAKPRATPPAPKVFPACSHLPAALAGAKRGPADLAELAEAFEALAPSIAWRLRPSEDAIFSAGHANAWVVGPGEDALEPRSDVWVGVSLIAPDVTYPDHQHPPEEVYIVLSDGDWRQGNEPWFTPGLGGIVYNPPGIVHAMRARRSPLFAVWCLPA